ncbi:type II toxin-antitoxin system Phd/YefM family antitoxin [Synechococcus sp. CS-1332]|uniref:type II toxin-antitoxin system Phd/YefM family antitoxin n=1 Tax=Synechococcus sp. CS-1332 TaxID=2847972 RepID=UPI00223BC438|nr:type II toxin-antitoxin system prevent-host-death family antitoxin [Synechococcus sp. CS-1332]MCT0209067.1 type II toxin-antitoxin system prevent-host-death family antitoxin [Synechococcus sp. CS-1332]
MAMVNVHQAKTHLSQLLQDVEQGQEVVIARLVAWKPEGLTVAAPGAMRGQIVRAADFNAPLVDLFEDLAGAERPAEGR